MTAWFAVAIVLLPGAALVLAMGRRWDAATALVDSVATGMVVTVTWLAVLNLIGIRWNSLLLLLPSVGGIVALGLRRARVMPFVRDGSGWMAAALALALAHAWVLARVQAFGWDFRYIWGLKARVFAAAGSHAGGWLAWPPHSFAHPTYPPLWPDLLAIGGILGASVSETAAAWDAVLVVALAAACWMAAAGAPPSLRFVAALVGAVAPVIFTRIAQHSGYAEPLVAVLAAAALASLGGREDDARQVGLVPILAAALALAKNEGLALAAGIALAALLTAPRRGGLAVVAAVSLAAGWWFAFLATHGVSDQHLNLDPSRTLRRLEALPKAFTATATVEVALLAAAWVAALIALRGPALRGVRLALAVFAVGAIGAYATSAEDLAWQMGVSLSRVLAAPLPGVVALAIGASWRRGAAGPLRA